MNESSIPVAYRFSVAVLIFAVVEWMAAAAAGRLKREKRKAIESSQNGGADSRGSRDDSSFGWKRVASSEAGAAAAGGGGGGVEVATAAAVPLSGDVFEMLGASQFRARNHWNEYHQLCATREALNQRIECVERMYRMEAAVSINARRDFKTAEPFIQSVIESSLHRPLSAVGSGGGGGGGGGGLWFPKELIAVIASYVVQICPRIERVGKSRADACCVWNSPLDGKPALLTVFTSAAGDDETLALQSIQIETGLLSKVSPLPLVGPATAMCAFPGNPFAVVIAVAPTGYLDITNAAIHLVDFRTGECKQLVGRGGEVVSKYMALVSGMVVSGTGTGINQYEAPVAGGGAGAGAGGSQNVRSPVLYFTYDGTIACVDCAMFGGSAPPPAVKVLVTTTDAHKLRGVSNWDPHSLALTKPTQSKLYITGRRGSVYCYDIDHSTCCVAAEKVSIRRKRKLKR